MINGLEGIPGSGKSYEAAAHQVMAALQAGTLVITNLPLNVDKYAAIDPAYSDLIELRKVPRPVFGTWDATRMDPETGQGEAFQLFADGHTESPPEHVQPFGHVWDYYSTWKHPKTGRGPLFVVDEAHEAMPDIGTDPQVISWYKLHRHFNADVLLMTQSFRDMNQKISRLMGMVIKVRKADVLGKPYHYIRKVHAGYRGAVISTEERKYIPEFFELYKSHTQGNSVAESAANDVAPLSVKLKKLTRFFWILSAIAVLLALWYNLKPKPQKPVHKVPTNVISRTPFPPASTPSAPSKPASEPAHTPPQPTPDPAPYAAHKLHITGMLAMRERTLYTFAVSTDNGVVVTTVTSDDLKKIGYKYEPLTDCAGYLRWGKTVSALICDSPNRGTGFGDKPIVISNGYGSDGRVPPERVHLEGGGPASRGRLPQDARADAQLVLPRRQAGQVTQADVVAQFSEQRTAPHSFNRQTHP